MTTATRLHQLANLYHTEQLVLSSGCLWSCDPYTPSSFSIPLNSYTTPDEYCQMIAKAIGSNKEAVIRYY
jgi:hypothetical protein